MNIVKSGLTTTCLLAATLPALAEKEKTEGREAAITVHTLRADLTAEGANDDAEMSGLRLEGFVQVHDTFIVQAERISLDGDNTDYSQTSIALLITNPRETGTSYYGAGRTTASGKGEYFDYDHTGYFLMLGGRGDAFGDQLQWNGWVRVPIAHSDDSKDIDFGLELRYKLNQQLSVSALYMYSGIDNFETNKSCFIFCSSEDTTTISTLGLGVNYAF